MSYRAEKLAFPKAIRETILREEPICRGCRKAPSVEADHIVPTAFGGSNTRDNGQGLCASCHALKTKAEQREGLRRRAARAKFPPERHPGFTG